MAFSLVVPVAFADGTSATDSPTLPITSRIPATDPLNGGFLIVNMHGMLFHPALSDIQEDLSYARWLGGGVIRVFGTDSNGGHPWDGARVGSRIAEIAPLLRAANLRLIVAFVNNHQAVPGEAPDSAGWMDNYMQLLLPFYTTTWRGPYSQFVHDLITTVQAQQAQDVIFAWELGNELHTPRQPDALVPFISQDVAQVRALDPLTPILPGTMGANHVEPGNPHSSIARWLYCDAPVDAYTLHAYDWVSRDRPGDMPIDWDLDNIVSQPCPNGRKLPVIVEELGTSRSLPGIYTADDEASRLAQERSQIEFVRHFPQVVGWGVWNGESPRLVDRTFIDTRRGLTSYGTNALGGGSCYDPMPDPAPGARCQLEQILRGTRFVRVGAATQWSPGPDADPRATNPLLGSVDPVYSGDSDPALKLTGWVLDPTAGSWSGVFGLDAVTGSTFDGSAPIAQAQLGLPRSDAPDSTYAGFTLNLPIDNLAPGVNQLTLAAHTPDHGIWLSTVQVVVPNLGPIPPRVAVQPSAPVPAPLARLNAIIQSPQPGDQVPRTFILQVQEPNADHIDVFLEPDRDLGGREVGFAAASANQQGPATLKAIVDAPLGGHTLYVHVSSQKSGQEEVLTLPVVVRS